MFQGKIAMVTGGSRGIGQAIVRELGGQGATVIFTYAQNQEAAQAVEREVEGSRGVQCTGLDTDEVNRLVDRIKHDHGRIDIFVNNAGVVVNQVVLMTSETDWDRVMETNLKAVFRWTKAVLRPMLAQRFGAILSVASVSGLFGVAGQSAYSASKGALIAFTRSVAAEVANRGVRINSIVPGFIETDMTAKLPKELQRLYQERIPLKRFGRPEEVAKTAAFMLSDHASYIVGQTLVMDGGLTSAVG